MNNIHKLNGFIYVTSEEDVKKGDWFKTPANDVICANIEWVIAISKFTPKHNFKKIILTNDPKLTNVQKLTPEEEAYCKTVDSVEVLPMLSNNQRALFGYKLQRPKQEQVLIQSSIDSDLIWREGCTEAVKTLYDADDMINFANLFAVVEITKEHLNNFDNQNKKK